MTAYSVDGTGLQIAAPFGIAGAHLHFTEQDGSTCDWCHTVQAARCQHCDLLRAAHGTQGWCDSTVTGAAPGTFSWTAPDEPEHTGENLHLHTACERVYPGAACLNDKHDHRPVDEHGEPCHGDTMRCNDCRRPSHYDSGDENYHHDDPTAACFLIRADETSNG